PPLGKIERVILVDDGGNEEDWTLPDLLGLRSILDKLEHLVSHHDVAGRNSEIFTDLERAEVDLRWNRPTLGSILQEVLIAIEQGLPTAINGCLKRRRIAHQEICGRERFADLREQKSCTTRLLRLQPGLQSKILKRL